MAIERMGQIAPNWKPNSSARNGNPMNTTKTTAANPQDNTAFLRRMLFTTATPLSYEAQLCRPHGTLAWAHASADTKPFAVDINVPAATAKSPGIQSESHIHILRPEISKIQGSANI